VWDRPLLIGWQQARAAPPPVGESDAAGRDGRGRCTRLRGTAGGVVGATVPSSVLEEAPLTEESGLSARRRLAGDAREGSALDPAPTLGRSTFAAVVLASAAAFEPAPVTTRTPDRREASGLGLSDSGLGYHGRDSLDACHARRLSHREYQHLLRRHSLTGQRAAEA